jgi:hypothetical protein
MRTTHLILLLLISAAASWLTTVVDDGLGLVWTYNVVRNWEDFGFFHLHGQLVYNAGGYGVETQPEIYTGHRALGLYPFFLVQTLFHAHGPAIYYAIVAAMVLLSIWQLLGRTNRAFWLAGIAVLTPGFLRWQTSLDPNLATVLAGFPYCAFVIWLLHRERLGLLWAGLLLGIIVVYSAINWTTIIIQAMLFAALVLLPGVSRKNLLIYVILVAAPAALVVAAGVIDKMGGSHHGSGSGAGLAAVFESYGWGNRGYGLDLSTRTAFLRLFTVNLIGLLPVVLFVSWQLWRESSRSATVSERFFYLPFLASVFCVAVLRNYFGHHPWMSCPFLLLGLILSFAAWGSTHKTPDGVVKADEPPGWRWSTLAVVFAYSFMVLEFYRIHNADEQSLMKFVRCSTARSATIVISRESDPALAGMAERLSEPFDRHVTVSDSIPNSDPGVTNVFWLTATAANGHKLAAASTGGDNVIDNAPVIAVPLRWYSRFIAHRRPGDKMEVAGKYYLYQ